MKEYFSSVRGARIREDLRFSQHSQVTLPLS